MRYSFSSITELKQLLADLEQKINKGILVTDDPLKDADLITAGYELPEEVKQFFYDNSLKPYKLLDELPVPFFIKDSNCGWFYVNQAFCRSFEVTLDNIFKKTSHAIFPKAKADLFFEQDLKIMETGKESSLELEINTADGKSRVILTTKSLFYDINNTPYIIGTFSEITGFKEIESTILQEKAELELLVKGRTELLTSTIEKLQDEITQRNKTEEALIQEEDKFRNVIEQAIEGICLMDTSGRIIEWNDTMGEITGITKQKALGEHIWDVEFQTLTPEKKTKDYLGKIKEFVLSYLKNEAILPGHFFKEGTIITPDGKKKMVNFSTFPIKTQNSFYLGRIVRDVTEQNKYLLALQKSEAQYRALFENSNEAILIVNPENCKILAANPRAAEIYGYRLEKFIGMPLEQISKNYETDLYQIEQIKNNNVLKNFETIHISNKAAEMYMLVNGSIVDYGGKTAIMNFNRDISELKRLEKARETVYKISQLAHTVENIEDLYKSIHKIINEVIPAKNFYIALYDEKSEIIFFPYFIDEKDSPPDAHKLRRGLTEYVLRHGKPVLTNRKVIEQLEMSGEIEMLGTYSDVWLGVPLITHGKVIGVVAVQSYTGEMAYTDNEKDLLLFVSEQIAHQIYKRQAEEEILRGKERAEESDRLKTSLITNMNHDLRTPMTGIMGFAALLKSRLKDPESASMADTILEASNKLMSIINSILQLSQLEADQKAIDFITGDLNKYADISVQQIEPKAKQKGLYVMKSFKDKVFAMFNENYLLQVLNNLIINAVSYTENGGITIKTGYTVHQEKEFAFIQIEDTGIGIAESNFNLIFQEFRQVSEGLNRKYDGSGLGLSLCKKMIEMMGGQILVDSSIGKGSVFTVLLLIPPMHNLKKPEHTKRSEAFKPSRIGKNKHKVLVVEDNKINGELINAMLKENYEVDIAKTGHLAIELVKRSEYDIVLMDINLGIGMTGINAAKEIHSYNKDLPIIAMTGYTTEKEIEQIMKHSFTGFVLKPVDKMSLYKVLEKSIVRKKE